MRPGAEGGDVVGGGSVNTDDVVELAFPPSLGRLYARGLAGSVAGSVAAAAGRSGAVGSDDLPTTGLLLRDVRADAEHLTAYQHLVGEPARDQLPAGFVHVLAFPVAMALMVRRDFPLPLLGMVHVANRVEQRRALRLEETLDVVVRARDLRRHRAGVTVDVVAQVSAGDDVVWKGTSTYLAKGLRLDGQDDGQDAPSGRSGPAAPSGEPDREARPVPTGRWRLPADVGRRYAAVSGDRNPIHLSPLAAKAFGFRRAIAHGMYTAARALADLGPAARGETFAWEISFAKPVLLPSTIGVRIAAEGAQGPGYVLAGWDVRTGRRHFVGSVVPER